MPPKTMSKVTGSRRLVICDHCGKEYEQRNLKEDTKRVNLGCPHCSALGKACKGVKGKFDSPLNPNPRHPGPLLCVMCFVLCVMCYGLCVMCY